jgi:Protein of unknown function (DUF2934)
VPWYEKADFLSSAFSVSFASSDLPIWTQLNRLSVLRSITRTEGSMKTMPIQTLSKTQSPEPMLEHAIRLRAFELYAQRGMAEGHAVHDWLTAEAELLHAPLYDLK